MTITVLNGDNDDYDFFKEEILKGIDKILNNVNKWSREDIKMELVDLKKFIWGWKN